MRVEALGSVADQPRNSLLLGLGENARAQLLDASSMVELGGGELLFRHDDPVIHVLFPESGVISMVACTSEGGQVESGVVGREGALGLTEALALAPIYARATVQIPGRAWRTPAEVCREVFGAGPARRLVEAYTQAMLAEARQSIACQTFHRLEPRLARWLLECRERGELGVELPLTQEFMAIMLGVQRTSVNAVMASLERRGAVWTGRARVRILDIQALEDAACDCRRAIQRHRSALGV